MEIALGIGLICGFICIPVMRKKGRSGFGGFILGLLLGFIGLGIALFINPDKNFLEQKSLISGELKKCPYCSENVKGDAIICKHCGKELPQNLLDISKAKAIATSQKASANIKSAQLAITSENREIAGIYLHTTLESKGISDKEKEEILSLLTSLENESKLIADHTKDLAE